MIKIELNQPSAAYAPSEPIAGTISWSELDEKTDRIEIRLIWYTSGKGDTDVEVVLAEKVDTPPTNGKANFNFVAPTRPMSFSGKLISLTWAVEVVEFPSRDGVKETLVLSPDRNEIILDQTFDEKVNKPTLSFMRVNH